MARAPHGFWLATLAVTWAALFTVALVAADALTPVA
jgi:hypothetical protein